MADLRKEYSASGLEDGSLPHDPMPLFRQWLEEAVNAQVRCLRACVPACMHAWGWEELVWEGGDVDDDDVDAEEG